MQTIYTTSYRLGMREKIVDLNAYRRQLEQSMDEHEEDIEVEPLVWAREDKTVCEEMRPQRRSRRAARAGAWVMDICASAGVLARTLAFTVSVL